MPGAGFTRDFGCICFDYGAVGKGLQVSMKWGITVTAVGRSNLEFENGWAKMRTSTELPQAPAKKGHKNSSLLFLDIANRIMTGCERLESGCPQFVDVLNSFSHQIYSRSRTKSGHYAISTYSSGTG